MSPEEAERAAKDLGVSPFVARTIGGLRFTVPKTILDLPCGHGRHSIWLARQGHVVTAGDIDPSRVREVANAFAQMIASGSRALFVDAMEPLPFPRDSFDGAVIVDFVKAPLLEQIHRVVRRGGFLVYETFSGRGNNCEMLLPVGQTQEILGPKFDLIAYRAGAFGEPGAQTETVKLFGVRL